jgi:hypothetical protein
VSALIPDGRKWVIVAGEGGRVTAERIHGSSVGYEIVDKWRESDDLIQWDHATGTMFSAVTITLSAIIAITGLKLRA